MAVRALSYFGVSVKRLDNWMKFGTDVLGLMVADDGDGANRLRADHRAWRIAANQGEEVGDPPAPPEEPRAERLLIMDATTEAVVNIAMSQTRGLALYRDELGGWFGSIDAYNENAGAIIHH